MDDDSDIFYIFPLVFAGNRNNKKDIIYENPYCTHRSMCLLIAKSPLFLFGLLKLANNNNNKKELKIKLSLIQNEAKDKNQ